MTMRHPPKGEVWLHIDRLDKKNEKIWAVQFWEGQTLAYRVAQTVTVNARAITRFFGPRSRKQPRAVVVCPNAVVSWTRWGMVINDGH